MAVIPTGAAQYLARFGNSSIACNQYAIAKLGIENRQCFLKLDEYIILCASYQLGFRRAIFLASLSTQEIAFFQKYVNELVGLSMTFGQKGKEPIKLFIRCTLTQIGQMKGRENVGLFVVDFKNIPDDLITIMGRYLEHQDLLKVLYEDFGASPIRMTAVAAKVTGYNMYATISEPGKESKRIQLYNFSTKVLEHLEAANGLGRMPGTAVSFQLYFQKYRFSVSGKVVSCETLQNGIMKTSTALEFNPELVEIIDDYWIQIRSNPGAMASSAGMAARL
jgi:hypothetical protein